MSHFTRIKTKIRDLETVKAALVTLGITKIEEGQNLQINGWQGAINKTNAVLKFKMPNGYEIGLSKADDDSYNVEGDLMMANFNVQKLNKAYANITIRRAAEIQGFNVVEEIEQKDGSVKLVVELWT